MSSSKTVLSLHLSIPHISNRSVSITWPLFWRHISCIFITTLALLGVSSRHLMQGLLSSYRGLSVHQLFTLTILSSNLTIAYCL